MAVARGQGGWVWGEGKKSAEPPVDAGEGTARVRPAVDRRRHLERVRVAGPVGPKLVRGDQGAAEAGGGVLAVDRPEVALLLVFLAVSGAPVEHDQISGDGLLGPRWIKVRAGPAHDGRYLELVVEALRTRRDGDVVVWPPCRGRVREVEERYLVPDGIDVVAEGLAARPHMLLESHEVPDRRRVRDRREQPGAGRRQPLGPGRPCALNGGRQPPPAHPAHVHAPAPARQTSAPA